MLFTYVGVACSLSLVVLFIASIFYKVASLTELDALKERMSHEQREDFVLFPAPLSIIMIVSVVGTLALIAFVGVLEQTEWQAIQYGFTSEEVRHGG